MAGACNYRVGYLEGSSIAGRVLRDAVTLAAPTQQTQHAQIYFGCQLRESGKFRTQGADGILGLQADDHGASPRTSRIPSVLQALGRLYGAANAFSLCLSDRSGLLLLGGRTDSTRLGRCGMIVAPMVAGSPERFTLRLRDIRIDARRPFEAAAEAATTAATNASTAHFVSLNLSTAILNPTFVDSGTTFFFASAPVFAALHAHLRRHMPTIHRFGAHHICAMLTTEQRDALPSLQLVLDGRVARGRPVSVRDNIDHDTHCPREAAIYVRPRQYMVRYPVARGSRGERRSWERHGVRRYCAEIFNNGPSGGTVLGASVLRHREVIFDIDRSTIAFSDADCDTLTSSTALMQRAWAFAGGPCANSK